MGKIKSCNIFSTFVADFIEKYGISDYEERKFIANCFLNFVNSIESADDIQRLLCIPEISSQFAMLHLILYKKYINSIDFSKNNFYTFFFPLNNFGSIESSDMDFSNIIESPVHKDVCRNFGIVDDKGITCLKYFLQTFENIFYKKLFEYRDLKDQCSLVFSYEGQNSIYELNLSTHGWDILKKLHFDTIQEITQFSFSEFSHISGVGGNLCQSVLHALNEAGFSFRSDDIPFTGYSFWPDKGSCK